MSRSSVYPAELRQRAVRMVAEVRPNYDSDYAAITAVAQKLGVRHETPQALMIRDRRVIWAASHFRVTAKAVDAAIKAAAQ